MKFNISLEETDLQKVVDALIERPFKEVSGLLNTIMLQVQEQKNAANSTDTTESRAQLIR